MLHYINATVGCLLQAGFVRVDRSRMDALDCHIYGFTLQEQHFPVDPEDYASAARSFLPMLSPEEHPYMREIAEKVADGSHDGRMDFGFGLELILHGLERLLGARRAPAEARCHLDLGSVARPRPVDRRRPRMGTRDRGTY